MTRRIYMNEDDAHFYSCHPEEDMTVEALERLVDYYAEETQVAAVLFCANLQKALFDSKTMEPLYEGYDPDGGPNQPFLEMLSPELREIIPGDHARNWVHNLWLMNRGRGIDHLAVWLARCRQHPIEGWITVRMNDAHGLEEYEKRVRGEDNYDGWAMLCPSTLWKEHPELRRAPYRWERSWEGAYDYARPAVRELYLAFIREILERYDMDGLEMDWMRWGMNFIPGHEAEGRAILTEFVREVRKTADASAKRVGHPVRLGVRVPTEIQTCWGLGYDVPAWTRQNLVDQVVLSSHGGFANYNFPIEQWRLILGDGVRLLTHCSDHMHPYAEYGKPVGHEEIFNGCAASALHRGSDGVYLFNECYTESSDPAFLKRVLQRLGDLETLTDKPRRHIVGYPGIRAAGDTAMAVLPIPLRNDNHGWDFGRMEDNISVRVYTGPRPASGRAVLYLAFSPDAPAIDANEMTVRLNSEILEAAAETPPSAVEANRIDWCRDYSDRIGRFLRYEIPLKLIQDDSNMVEFVPPKADGELRWVEVSITP